MVCLWNVCTIHIHVQWNLPLREADTYAKTDTCRVTDGKYLKKAVIHPLYSLSKYFLLQVGETYGQKLLKSYIRVKNFRENTEAIVTSFAPVVHVMARDGLTVGGAVVGQKAMYVHVNYRA